MKKLNVVRFSWLNARLETLSLMSWDYEPCCHWIADSFFSLLCLKMKGDSTKIQPSPLRSSSKEDAQIQQKDKSLPLAPSQCLLWLKKRHDTWTTSAHMIPSQSPYKSRTIIFLWKSRRLIQKKNWLVYLPPNVHDKGK